MTCDQPRIAHAIDRLFVGGLRDVEWEELRKHVGRCTECRDRYDRLSRVKAALEGEAGLPSDQLRLLESGILDRVSGRPPARARGLIAALAGAAALAGIVVTLLVTRAPSDEYRSRGAGAVHTEGFRAFCIQPGATPTVAAEAGPGTQLHCRRGDSLQFSYTSGRAAQLAVVGIGPQGEWLPYFPASGTSERIEAGAVDHPIPYSTPLGPEHPLGAIQIIAVHASRPLDSGEVERVARQSAAGAVPKNTPMAGVESVQQIELTVDP